MELNRREFLLANGAAITSASLKSTAAAQETPENAPTQIIDTHTHFYDPTRPEGVPWPNPNDSILYRRTLPEDFRGLAGPLACRSGGTDCSPAL